MASGSRDPKGRVRNAALTLESPEFLTREQALGVLGVKAATLYTYVSRGLVRSVPAEGSRRRLFSREDVSRLVTRSHAQDGATARAESAMRWGEPIIKTQIAEITPDGPLYRGHSAIELMRSGVSFEAVAMMLWFGSFGDEQLRFAPQHLLASPDAIVVSSLGPSQPLRDVLKVFTILVLAAGLPDRGLGEYASGQTALVAQQIIQVLAAACGYIGPPNRFLTTSPDCAVADTITRALLGRPDDQARSLINAALVLCADFELAPGTFAARVAASAGADLYNCVAAGMSGHAGVLTGRGSDKAEELMRVGSEQGMEKGLDMLKQHGRSVFGFNHYYFPKGDPRAFRLMDLARTVDPLPEEAGRALDFLEEAQHRLGAYPGVAIGLVTLCLALGLPRRSAVALWAVARAAGHIAHTLEQRLQNFVIRPRAQPVGRPP